MFLKAIPELSEDLDLVSKEIGRLADLNRKNDATGDILNTVLSTSGKGYRPMLLLLVSRLGPSAEATRQRLCRLGALVEYVHMASLVHDDIVDDSPKRRGAPTIQAKYGKDMAVFTGDLMLSQVMQVLLEDGLRESGLLIAHTLRDMCVGEITQADHLYDCDTTVEQYYQTIFGKTASLFATACKIGAAESGQSRDAIELLGEFGRHLGYLFQIRDDLRDFLPDTESDGKPVRQDFREGILTLPVLYAIENPRCKEGIQSLVERARSGQFVTGDAVELDTWIRRGNGFAMAVAEAEQNRKRACALLEKLEKSPARDMLRELLESLLLPDFS